MDLLPTHTLLGRAAMFLNRSSGYLVILPNEGRHVKRSAHFFSPNSAKSSADTTSLNPLLTSNKLILIGFLAR